ncbi:Fic/DOC family protein [Alkalicoccus urumqiensis]|uniref:protein adenylyltransferase n=1 Tax=Alkalicoccus urumqiensis TaxID=1548213 RepID=A0A2P6MHM5_ALKUR|nr:Fic family protein [Alkalicoccus urumqiensis]PRO65792.1 hypothetical protein C6I21_07800 [Alkalicoccus urumqiensis]
MTADKYETFDNDDFLLQENLLDAAGLEELESLEALAFAARAAQVQDWAAFSASFSEARFKALHGFLFQDVYAFAGTYRTVNIAKGGTRFCQAAYIEENAASLFDAIGKEPPWQSLEEAAYRLAHFKTELNMLHPFREGNGRVIRFFIYGWALSRNIVWQLENMTPDTYLDAMIASVTDEQPLIELFRKTIHWKA